mgnify:CR=1 FL=1
MNSTAVITYRVREAGELVEKVEKQDRADCLLECGDDATARENIIEGIGEHLAALPGFVEFTGGYWEAA